MSEARNLIKKDSGKVADGDLSVSVEPGSVTGRLRPHGSTAVARSPDGTRDRGGSAGNRVRRDGYRRAAADDFLRPRRAPWPLPGAFPAGQVAQMRPLPGPRYDGDVVDHRAGERHSLMSQSGEHA